MTTEICLRKVVWRLMWIGLIALLIVGIWLYVIAPGHCFSDKRAPFLSRTFAHRGLYREDQSLPENTLPAFMKAISCGYGIELDVQLTRDKQIVVFHDETLLRACGVDARVDAYTYAELREMPLFRSSHRIPLFSDVLALVAGRVPLIVELKAGGDWRRLCADTYALLTGYRGAYCIESFHPRLVQWFRLHAPEVLRGQLSEAYHYSRRFLPWYEALMMSRLFTNLFTRPHFVAYRIGPRCLSERVCEWMGAMRVRWTARPADDWEQLTESSDAIIFEFMRPGTRFTKGQSALPVVTEIKQAQEHPAAAYTDASL